MGEERQWRVKATLEKQRKHAKIVGVSDAGIRLYDDMGQVSALGSDLPLSGSLVPAPILSAERDPGLQDRR